MSTKYVLSDGDAQQGSPVVPCTSLFSDERVVQFRDVLQRFIEGLATSPLDWNKEDFEAQRTRLIQADPEIEDYYLYSILTYCQLMNIDMIDPQSIPFASFFLQLMNEFGSQQHKVPDYVKHWNMQSRILFVEQLIRTAMRRVTRRRSEKPAVPASKSEKPAASKGSKFEKPRSKKPLSEKPRSVASSSRARSAKSIAGGGSVYSRASFHPDDSVSVAHKRIDASIMGLLRSPGSSRGPQ